MSALPNPGDPAAGTAAPERHCVYGIVRAAAALPAGMKGLEEAAVGRVVEGGLAALVSRISLEAVRPERRHLAAFQRVLAAATAECDLLPVSFGTIAEDEAAVRQLLAEQAEGFQRELARISGRVEMTVKLRWRGEDIFRFFVERYPELQRRRDACFDGHREPGQMELLDLGRYFEQLLDRDREEQTSEALAYLRMVAVELKVEPPTDEKMMFNIMCLINRATEARFEQIVGELADGLDDSYLIEVNGPWPPYSFVSLSL